MKNPSVSVGMLMFASAIASAIAVAAFALFLQGKIETIAAARTKETAALNKDNSAAQVHAIAQITAPQRASLEVVLKPDVLSIVNTLTDTGKDAGVDLQVSNAVPETIATQKGATTALHAVGFTLSGVGTFSNLMTAAALLEKLPIASSIERIDMLHVASDPQAHSAPAWHIDVRVRVLTSAPISP